MTLALSPALGRISSRYGPRNTGIPGATTMHRGVDIAAPRGTHVRAPRPGVVTVASSHPVRGLYVVIRHSATWSTLHQHLARIDVKPGDRVAFGEVIGAVGTTGLSSGPHLHTEVHRRGTPIDPTPWYAARRCTLGDRGTPGTYRVTARVYERTARRLGRATRLFLREHGHSVDVIATWAKWALTSDLTYLPLRKIEKTR